MSAVSQAERRSVKRIVLHGFVGVLVVGVWLSVGLAAVAEAPELTETDRLRIIALSQAMEIAQLKAQAAQRDYVQAREELRTVAARLERPGYTLDLQTLTYRAVAAPETKP